MARSNLLAYSLQSGNLISSFAPVFNAQVLAVAVTPDQSRIYVAGDFTQVNGQPRNRIAAFNATTGALLSFNPSLNGSARALVATNTTAYVGGAFSAVGNVSRSRMAAFNSNGALLNWAPTVGDGAVWALTVKPDGSRVVVGGSFTSLNGSSNPGYGLGMVDAVTGVSLPFEVNNIVRDGTDNGAITTLHADQDYVYGGGYTFGRSGGTFEGVFAAKWNAGEVHWINDCHGDTYSVFPRGNVIYQAGHFHYCENIGGFRQGDGNVGDYPYNRATAMSREATGVATWEPDQGRYYSFEGQPAPSQLTWFPSMNSGTYTGQFQGPWSVTGNDNYIVMGGEFTRVNDTNQQGLVRYAVSNVAPNDRGPALFNTTYPIKVTSTETGKVRVNWSANYDMDNDYLTYRVYRDAQTATGLIHTRSARANYWDLNTMGLTDSGLAPGSNHQYRVVVTDPFGNVANSPWTAVNVASTGTDSAYLKAVYEDEPTYYWRMGEPGGTEASDTVGFRVSTLRAGATLGAPGAINNDNNTAARFDGTTAGYAATSVIESPPDLMTLEAWFKTTSTTGGKIAGFGNRNASNSNRMDRHLYMDNSGRVHFGVWPTATRQVLTTGSSYNDGQWHHVAGSLGPSGMKLYVDGARVADRSDVTVGRHLLRGYWRIGGDALTSWPSAPTSAFFNGDIDEVAVYKSVLTDADVAAHYATATGAPVPNTPPTAAFTSTVAGRTVSVNASGSSDSDGTIASYNWDFGDGGTASGTPASHTYATAGTYPVTLTVIDDDGATDTETSQVTVTDPPPGPVPFAVDEFERSVTGEWGSADPGGTWTRAGSTANFSVAGGVGLIRMNTAGAGPGIYLGGVSSTDTEARVQTALDKPATGGGVYLTVQGRRISDNDAYYAEVRHVADGSVQLAVGRRQGGAETKLDVETIAGLTYQVGDRLQVRLQVTGTSPTTLMAKVWKVGGTEPATWQVTATDSTAGFQQAGGIGIRTYLSGSATNAPVFASFDNLWAGPTA